MQFELGRLVVTSAVSNKMNDKIPSFCYDFDHQILRRRLWKSFRKRQKGEHCRRMRR